jgi:predicted N-acetyltransferase YhbS
MTKLIIRPALETESNELTNTLATSFKRDLSGTRQRKSLNQKIKQGIENKVTFFLVAEEKGQIIGTGGETRHIGSSYIGYLGVLPNFRKLGIGTKLFDKLVQQASIHNPTIELFANLGADKIYRRFGFEDEFHTHIFELDRQLGNINSDVKINTSSIPKWVYDLDQKAMGFDRSKLLNLLVDLQGTFLVNIEHEGYVLVTENTIGPLIAKDFDIAKSLLNRSVLTGTKRIISSSEFESDFRVFSPKKVHTCIKMKFGKIIRAKSTWIWGYHSFATS